MNELIKPEILSSLILNGDISKLTQPQKVDYYKGFCDRLGLDPLTQPFKILKLNGKEVLYCDRSGAQQLNKKHNVSHEIKTRDTVGDLYVVTCRASLPDGRFTESIGAVNIAGFKGDNLANAMMKGETKAKRRATMDLLGLGILDETETETIPQAQTLEVFDNEQLRDDYMALLVRYDSVAGQEKAQKLMPKDDWTADKFLSGIQWLKSEVNSLETERALFSTPQTIEAMGEAVQRAVDKDDFYEDRKSKKK
jgi:hypothetical protein